MTVLTFGCAPVAARKPIVYVHPPNANYDRDLRECQQFAQEAISEDPTVGQEAVRGGVGGALLGAALGAIVGGLVGYPGTGAGYGAAYGATLGVAEGAATADAELTRRRQEAILKCLYARGYPDASF